MRLCHFLGVSMEDVYLKFDNKQSRQWQHRSDRWINANDVGNYFLWLTLMCEAGKLAIYSSLPRKHQVVFEICILLYENMADLQAIIELSVELTRFVNVDLFQRGYYQVQLVLKTSLKAPLTRVEVSDIKTKEDLPENSNFQHNCIGKSRKFQILYRNEEVDIGEVFVFRIYALVESTKLEKNLENLDLKLDVQLWSNNEEENMEADAEMKLASSRILLLHFSPTKGLHYFLPVVFDYFHLAAMEVVIHGTVLSIQQPNLTSQKPQKSGKAPDQSSLEAVYFGQKSSSPPSNVTSKSAHLLQACLMHKRICSLLLSVHESLQNYLEQYVALVPGCKFNLESKDCLKRLEEIVKKVQSVADKNALIRTAIADITELCAKNVLLWAQFRLFALKQPRVHLYLATEHHNRRVHRFAEGFFTMEHNKSSCLSCYDPGFHGHSSLATMVKTSPYFCNLPSLPVECVELDGDENSLPIIFEDIFQDSRASPPQIYRISANITTDGTTAVFSREYSSSNSSLASDRGTPPHLRRRASSKKFSKNLKPAGFERPLSRSCKAIDPKLETVPTPFGGATLTGYRKIPVQEGPNLTNQLEKTYSLPLPSDLPSVCLNHVGEESIPDKDTCHPSLISSTTTTPISSVVCEPGVTTTPNHITTSSSVILAESPSIHLNSMSNDSLVAASNALTPPEANNFISFLEVCPSSDLQATNKLYSPNHQSNSKLSPPATNDTTVNTLSKLNSLVEDTCLALGEKDSTSLINMFEVMPSSHDNGFTDDSKNVSIGLDDVSYAYQNDFGVPSNDCSKDISIFEQDNLICKNISDISKQNGESFKHEFCISKQDCSTSTPDNGSSIQDCGLSIQDCSYSKQACGYSKQNCDTSLPTCDNIVQNNFAAQPSFLQDQGNSSSPLDVRSDNSQTPVSKTNDSEPLSDKFPRKTTSSLIPITETSSVIKQNIDVITRTDTANSKALSDTSFPRKTNSYSVPVSETSSTVKQNINVKTRTDVENVSVTPYSKVRTLADPTQKLTVMELLKEEYMLSREGGQDEIAVNNSTTTHLLTTSLEESSIFNGHRAASDSDILRNNEEKQRNIQSESQEPSKTISNGVEMRRALLSSSSSYPELSHSTKSETPRLVSFIGDHAANFAQLRDSLKLQMAYPGRLYSEFPVLASSIPYFQVPSDLDESSSGLHLIVCVHGLDGNSADLRLVKTYIEMSLPGFKLEFLMSETNQQDTFADFDKMTDRLVEEIMTKLNTSGLQVTRISFVGHSLGNIIIRSTLSRPEMSHLLPKLYTFLSLSGPHLGTLYNASGLVNMGLWFMQKLKRSGSLLQLSLKDQSDPRETFLYRLSQKPVLQYFKHILLVGSHQDRYVPYHSSRIEICRSAQKDTTVIGAVYREMVQNILEPIIQAPHCTLIRYDVFHALPSTANTMIGRAAHIAVLDSEMFIEKFLAVTGLKYFQ